MRKWKLTGSGAVSYTHLDVYKRQVFKRYMNVSVREYQKQNVGNGMQMHSEEEALQILVYLILNFHDPFQMKEDVYKRQTLWQPLVKKKYINF